MLNLSSLKLLSGVFFAAFILSACGGDSIVTNNPTFSTNYCAAGTEAVNNECVPISCDAGSALVNTQCVVTETFNDVYCSADTIADEANKQCVFNPDSCAVGTKVVDGKCVPTECPTGTRIAADKVTCETIPCQADQFLDGNNCVTALTADDCNVGTQLNASTNSCVVITCAVNQTLVGNDCVTMITCAAGEINVKNICQADIYTPKTYKYFDSRDANDDGIVTADELTALGSNEYSRSKALVGVNAAQAYVNIENLIDSANDGTGITQGGAGQIISIIAHGNFNTKHQEFTESGTQGAAFNSIYNVFNSLADIGDTNGDGTVDEDDRLFDDNAEIIESCVTTFCVSTSFASLIAGRKGNGSMHGIAFNAQLKGFITGADNVAGLETRLLQVIPETVGSDIIAMNYALLDGKLYDSCNAYDQDYFRPYGINVDTTKIDPTNPANTDCQKDTTQINHTLSNAELAAWTAAVDPAGTNKTIMVFGNGDNYANSETGTLGTVRPAAFTMGSVPAANIPAFRAGYPALYDESAGKDQIKDNDDDADGLDGIAGNDDDDDTDLTADRWLAVVGLGNDNNNGTHFDTSDDFFEADKISEFSNGCGVAMRHCLAADRKLHAAHRIKTNNAYNEAAGSNVASATVAGGLAVLKGAFPNATPEQLTKLVLETASYIPLDNKTPTRECTTPVLNGPTYCTNVDKDYVDSAGLGRSEDEIYRVEVTTVSGGKRYINPVYGYGKLDMAAATTPNITISYVTASNNTSIGALWQDTKLTLSSHFGNGLDDVKLGIGDAYGRHFISKANKTISKPVAAASFDDYMANMLGDASQSQTLGTQAQLNYSNSGETWMNLEYISGNATTKIAFQDNYKISPLSDTGTTTILRANNIRPASSNIGMMDVDYKLGNLTLSSYAARGEYDTGYKFDELGTDFDVNYKKSHLNIAIGNIREHGQFLGTNTSGAYALNAPSISRFTDVTYGHDIGAKFNIYANYINYETDVDMLHDQFASIDGLQADQYQIGFTGKDLMSKDDSLNVALITKLGVTDGALNQNTVLGYTADGAFNNASQSYDLAVSNRHQQFEITYQGKLYQNADKISALRDNRFFTSIRVDQNLNHVEGLGQTEIIGGINIRY